MNKEDQSVNNPEADKKYETNKPARDWFLFGVLIWVLARIISSCVVAYLKPSDLLLFLKTTFAGVGISIPGAIIYWIPSSPDTEIWRKIKPPIMYLLLVFGATFPFSVPFVFYIHIGLGIFFCKIVATAVEKRQGIAQEIDSLSQALSQGKFQANNDIAGAQQKLAALQADQNRNTIQRPSLKASLRMAAIFLVFAGIAEIWLKNHQMHRSSLLFIGIPTMLGIGLSFLPFSKTAVSATIKGVTLALLLSMIFLGEGVICVLFAAPLIYGIALLIAYSMDKEWRMNRGLFLILALTIMSFEGSCGHLSFTRNQHVRVTKHVPHAAVDIEQALMSAPRFDLALPSFLQLGFPRPQWIRSEGLALGDRWVVHFAGGEGKPGNLVLEVTERGPDHATFKAVADTSKIADWVTWQQAKVSWRAANSASGDTSSAVSSAESEIAGSEVTWELAWQRRVDPKWYFGPLQQFTAKLAASYLIDSLTVPRPDPLAVATTWLQNRTVSQ